MAFVQDGDRDIIKQKPPAVQCENGISKSRGRAFVVSKTLVNENESKR